jgi:hypothetical protein
VFGLGETFGRLRSQSPLIRSEARHVGQTSDHCDHRLVRSAGTTTVTTTFQNIFRREGVNAVIVHGDAFHRYDRNEMRVRRTEAENNGQMHFSRFGPEANLFEVLETLFRV